MLVDYYFSVSSIYLEKKFSGLSCSVACINTHSSKATTLLFLFIYIVYTPALLGSRVASSMQMIIRWIVIIWKEEGCWKPSVQVPKNCWFPVALGKSLGSSHNTIFKTERSTSLPGREAESINPLETAKDFRSYSDKQLLNT